MRLTLTLVFTLVGVLAGCENTGLNRSPVCSDQSPLGRVGAATEVIRVAEVRALVARVAVAGGNLSERDALIDLLWQERERQRLGLPGGPDAMASRRRLVQGHADRLRRGEVQPLRTDPSALPPGAELTDCGRKILEAGASR